jgi:hypothetical protein
MLSIRQRSLSVASLCGPGWLHAYESPLVAAFMNPIHADFRKPRLFEAEGKIGNRLPLSSDARHTIV